MASSIQQAASSAITPSSLASLGGTGGRNNNRSSGFLQNSGGIQGLDLLQDFDFDFDFRGLEGDFGGGDSGGGIFGSLGQMGSLATGLAGAYNAYQQNKLQNKAFKFQKGATNRNIANQAVVVNNDLANQAKMQAQMFGNKVGTQDYQNYISQNQQRVNGAPI